MKRIFSFVLTITVLLSFTLPVFAYAPNVVDEVDLLSQGTIAQLNTDAVSIYDEYGFDIVLLYCYSLEGQSANNYGDQYYIDGGFAQDGVVLIVSMEDRDWAIRTAGYGDYAFTEYGLDLLEEKVIPYLSDDDYEGAATAFISLASEMVEEAYTNTPYSQSNEKKGFFDGLFSTFIVLAVSAIIAGFYLNSLIKQMNNIEAQKSAGQYVKADTFVLNDQSDKFLYSTITKTEKPRDKDSTRSGGGGSPNRSGGRSGKF